MGKDLIICPHCASSLFNTSGDPEKGNLKCEVCGTSFPTKLVKLDKEGYPYINPRLLKSRMAQFLFEEEQDAYLEGFKDAFRILQQLRRSNPALDSALGGFHFERIEKMRRE